MRTSNRFYVDSEKEYAKTEAELFAIFNLHKKMHVVVYPGGDRTLEQNRLQRLWLTELELQGDMSSEEYRAYCKYHFGVPIRIADDEDFAAAYYKYIAPLPYEQALAFMSAPFDFAVTRDMTTKQKTKYLDAMYKYFTDMGFKLTKPKVENDY